MRTKTGYRRHRHHQKVLQQAKGYRMTRHRLFKVAHEAILHAGQYAFAGRKKRKKDLRKLWIIRLNAALRQNGLVYSRFIRSLKEKGILLNRKILAELAAREPQKFRSLLDALSLSPPTKQPKAEG